MKSAGIWIVVTMLALCPGFTRAWADGQASTSALNKRFTIYGGAQVYQAEGEFTNIEDGQPDVSVDLDDLGLDDNLVTPVAGALINFWGNRLTLRFDYFGYRIGFHEQIDGLVQPITIPSARSSSAIV